MAAPRSRLAVLALAALTTGACDRSPPPPRPPGDAPASASTTLRYAVPDEVLTQDIELQLTQTRLGLYLEAELHARAELRLRSEGDALHTHWTVTDVPSLTLDGTVEPGDVDEVRARLRAEGRGLAISDAHGVLDAVATDAAPVNVARTEAMTAGALPPFTVALIMAALVEQIGLPRLPAVPLVPDVPVQLDEESETVLTDPPVVLPTTTVFRFTLRKVDRIENTRVAEVELTVASVAQPEPHDPPTEGDRDDSEPIAELRTRAEGILAFDLDHHRPVDLELASTETLRVGEQEVERSLQVHARFTRTAATAHSRVCPAPHPTIRPACIPHTSRPLVDRPHLTVDLFARLGERGPGAFTPHGDELDSRVAAVLGCRQGPHRG